MKLIRSKQKEDDIVTERNGMTPEAKRKCRIKGLAQVRRWLAASSLTDEGDVVHEQKENVRASVSYSQTDEEYRNTVSRLVNMVTKGNPEEIFGQLKFMCSSSAEGCRLYITSLKQDPSANFVVKITNIKNKYSVMDVESELRLINSCDHPNIVKVYRSYFSKQNLWIALPLQHHGSLSALIERRLGQLNEVQIAYICLQILPALVYLHEEKFIMHLDIKGDNILVDKNYEMMITDFGVSVQLQSKDGKFNEMRGSSYWMCPEMIGENVSFTTKADIWSFGILVYETMHKGAPPRFELSPKEAIDMIRVNPVPKLEDPDRWSEELRDFLRVILCKDPNQRWSARELLQHEFLTSKGVLDPLLLFPKITSGSL